MRKTKTVFLLSGCTKYCVKQIGKELKKKKHCVKTWRTDKNLPRIEADTVIVVHDVTDEETLKKLKQRIETELNQRTGDNFLVFDYIYGMLSNDKEQVRNFAKEAAENIDKDIKKIRMGKDGLELYKTEYVKQVMMDCEFLLPELVSKNKEEAVLLKRMLLDIPSLRLRYGAMRYQKLHGNLLKQLLIFDDGYEWERCSTREEALTMLEDFLNAIDY